MTMSKEIASLQEQNKEIAQLEVALKELNDKLIDKAKEVVEHKSFVEKMNEKLSASKKEYQSLQERMTSSEEENDGLMKKKTKLYQIEMNKLEKQLKIIPEFHKQIEELKSEISAKTQEKEGLHETNRNLEAQITKLPTASAMEILTNQLSKAMSNNELSLTKINALSEENKVIVKLESDLAKANAMIEELEKEKEALPIRE
eukprot:CAMPEP_0172478230 /NCGR_PEP_ID=MMETSP1066-20121228/2023_1 /TAXON_ID=671091 /ORGANISM="Coscinodiscus wailesii, Strain CCMP2513" /LENGTH=201 /DNA_ID=CAMNT_0013237601 /DNA_START=704 /DNA_END=1306 /DNA_ORIENTATION=+